jgi:hypothetical protein
MRPWSPSVVSWLARVPAGASSKKRRADLLGERRPVVLEREEVVGALAADRPGDVGLAAHGVDGDERTLELEPRQEQRDRIDLVRLLGHGLLAEHQPARPGRDQVQRIAALRLAPPRGLAVDRNDVGRLLAQALHPGREALGEEARGQRVHHVVERVVRGDAAFERQQTAENVELALAPARDLDEVLRSAERRAEHDEQDLRQRIDHLPRLPWIFERREMVDERLAGHGEPRGVEVSHESQQFPCRNPPPLQAIALRAKIAPLDSPRSESQTVR